MDLYTLVTNNHAICKYVLSLAYTILFIFLSLKHCLGKGLITEEPYDVGDIIVVKYYLKGFLKHASIYQCLKEKK